MRFPGDFLFVEVQARGDLCDLDPECEHELCVRTARAESIVASVVALNERGYVYWDWKLRQWMNFYDNRTALVDLGSSHPFSIIDWYSEKIYDQGRRYPGVCGGGMAYQANTSYPEQVVTPFLAFQVEPLRCAVRRVVLSDSPDRLFPDEATRAGIVRDVARVLLCGNATHNTRAILDGVRAMFRSRCA